MNNYDQSNFKNEVLNSKEPVLIDFWASWCGPCKMVAPEIEKIAKEYENKIRVGKVNVDESPELASEYGIMSIPTILLFVKDAPVFKLVGFHEKKKIAAEIDKYI